MAAERGLHGCFQSSKRAQPHFLPHTAPSPEPLWSPKGQLVKPAALKAWAGEAITFPRCEHLAYHAFGEVPGSVDHPHIAWCGFAQQDDTSGCYF